MKTRSFILMFVCIALIYVSAVTSNYSKADVSYPEDYREWTHVSSAIIGPKSPAFNRYGGIHHIYANKKAMKGYSTGIFPNGSVIVFDVKELTDDDKGNTIEGNRKFIDVMIKDDALYDSTGGWGFEEFEKSSSVRNLTDLSKRQCFSCHLKLAPEDLVISKYNK